MCFSGGGHLQTDGSVGHILPVDGMALAPDFTGGLVNRVVLLQLSHAGAEFLLDMISPSSPAMVDRLVMYVR